MDNNAIIWIVLALSVIVVLIVFVIVKLSRNISNGADESSETQSNTRRVPFATLFAIYRNSQANMITLNREFTEPLPLYNSYRAQTQVLNAITSSDSNGLPPSYSNSEEVNQQSNNAI